LYISGVDKVMIDGIVTKRDVLNVVARVLIHLDLRYQ